MDYNAFLWDCKMAADQGISKIRPDSPVLTQIRGMSTVETRHCMNNLNRYGANYLEVGSFCGSTFVSSLVGHNKKGWSIDNYSEFTGPEYAPGTDGTHRDELLYNINTYLNCPTQYFQEDSFQFDPDKLEAPVDVFMYDGDHDQDKQRRALEHYYDSLNDVVLFIVDDWNSQAVRDGTYEGIRNTEMCILGEISIRTPHNSHPQYWSGLYAAFLAKECPADRFLQTSLSSGNCNFAHPIKDSRACDNVLRFMQPENGKSEEEIKKILAANFPQLMGSQINEAVDEGKRLYAQQETRGKF